MDLSEPGTTIHLRDGTYAPDTNIRLLRSGTGSQPITLRNHEGEHAVLDGLVTRDNYETGLHLVGGDTDVVSHNQVVNLDSYGNRDPRKNGESADGLAIKESGGEGNVVRGNGFTLSATATTDVRPPPVRSYRDQRPRTPTVSDQ